MGIARSIGRARIETKFLPAERTAPRCIARSIGRARIETRTWQPGACSPCGIARSIGRARIETGVYRGIRPGRDVSPDQLVGRGLKPDGIGEVTRAHIVSPDQLVGRGLKLLRPRHRRPIHRYRPINWSGAD